MAYDNHRVGTLLITCLCIGTLTGVGCTDDDDDPSVPDSGMVQPDAGMNDIDAPPADGDTVPSNAAALFPFLQARAYDQFAVESGIHASSGPHGGNVRTFINDALADSLAAGNEQHPAGAATIKELYQSDGSTLNGWAVMVKTDADSAGGQGWYWYEIFSTTDSANPVVDGNGVGLCTSCHSSGDDYFRSPYPLQ